VAEACSHHRLVSQLAQLCGPRKGAPCPDMASYCKERDAHMVGYYAPEQRLGAA
jgi:hypothetical protein